MSVVLVVAHIFVCVFLVAVVLLQRGKGAEIGAVFGGGASTTVFGSRGAGNFLSRLTTIAAAVFMLTSLGLSYLWSDTASEGLFSDTAVEEVPAAEAPLFEELGQAPPAETEPAPATAEPSAPEPPAPGGGAPAQP